MRAIVTVMGKDRPGIIAAVCDALSQNRVNVMDISQTVLQEYFTMIMLVNIADCPISFQELSNLLKEMGEKQALYIRAQREDIFNAMHRI